MKKGLEISLYILHCAFVGSPLLFSLQTIEITIDSINEVNCALAAVSCMYYVYVYYIDIGSIYSYKEVLKSFPPIGSDPCVYCIGVYF